MSDRELYQQKLEALLEEWQAELDRLKATAAEGSAETQSEINQRIEAFESRLQSGKTKLVELSAADESVWESIKGGLESAWDASNLVFDEPTLIFWLSQPF